LTSPCVFTCVHVVCVCVCVCIQVLMCFCFYFSFLSFSSVWVFYFYKETIHTRSEPTLMNLHSYFFKDPISKCSRILRSSGLDFNHYLAHNIPLCDSKYVSFSYAEYVHSIPIAALPPNPHCPASTSSPNLI
jgi:hypothetical protein